MANDKQKTLQSVREMIGRLQTFERQLATEPNQAPRDDVPTPRDFLEQYRNPEEETALRLQQDMAYHVRVNYVPNHVDEDVLPQARPKFSHTHHEWITDDVHWHEAIDRAALLCSHLEECGNTVTHIDVQRQPFLGDHTPTSADGK